MDDSPNCWDQVWSKEGCVSDYTLRWYMYLANLSLALLPNQRVLEAGSGSGGGIAIFARAGHEAYGVDNSAVAIEKSRKAHPEVNFVHQDLFDMQFEKDSFDLIFSSGLIEHFKYPENIRVIRVLNDLLKPGGLLVTVVPNSFCLWYLLGKKILTRFNRWPYGYEDSYSPFLFNNYLSEIKNLRLARMFGLQVLPMLAVPGFELLPLGPRRAIARTERYFPFSRYYSYALLAETMKEA